MVSSEVELAGQIQRLISRNLVDFHRVLTAPSDAATRYTALQSKKPAWSRPQLVKSLVAGPANKSAGLGAGAGGGAFVPGIGTGLAVAGVAGTSLKLLEACIECIDVVARSYDFPLDDALRRNCARLSVLHMSTPQRTRMLLTPPPPSSAVQLVRWPAASQTSLLASSDDILRRWAVAVASWRLSAAAPFGLGALMGAWTSYAPIKLSVHTAEQFFGDRSPGPGPDASSVHDPSSGSSGSST